MFDHSIADKIKDQLQSQVDFYADKYSLVVMSELQNVKVAKLTYNFIFPFENGGTQVLNILHDIKELIIPIKGRCKHTRCVL